VTKPIKGEHGSVYPEKVTLQKRPARAGRKWKTKSSFSCTTRSQGDYPEASVACLWVSADYCGRNSSKVSCGTFVKCRIYICLPKSNRMINLGFILKCGWQSFTLSLSNSELKQSPRHYRQICEMDQMRPYHILGCNAQNDKCVGTFPDMKE
jgi:hypothetical protein